VQIPCRDFENRIIRQARNADAGELNQNDLFLADILTAPENQLTPEILFSFPAGTCIHRGDLHCPQQDAVENSVVSRVDYMMIN
jgi:hypothetical protein